MDREAIVELRVGEYIEIGDNIIIKIVRIRGNACDIGIEADPSIPIIRED